MNTDTNQPEPNGRVVVFNQEPDEDGVPGLFVYAVPGHWDDDDLNRFVQAKTDEWTRATVTRVEPIPAEFA